MAAKKLAASLNQTQRVKLDSALEQLQSLSTTANSDSTVFVADSIPVSFEDAFLKYKSEAGDIAEGYVIDVIQEHVPLGHKFFLLVGIGTCSLRQDKPVFEPLTVVRNYISEEVIVQEACEHTAHSKHQE